jgi:hypothetical protein
MRNILVAALFAAAPAAAMDYARPEAWLCRPDANGPCDTDLSLTDISGAGVAPVDPPPAADPRIDCFYVYPTVSTQPTGNADGTLTDDERYVVRQQFARFAGVCRRFAPLYRQATLGSIWGKAKPHPTMAYDDVKAAWAHYMAHDNGGRGVLLFGHSQGARHLRRLISEEIAGKPVERQIVSAWLIGFPVATGTGAPPMLPPCRTATDSGCLVAYATFTESAPPAADNRFAGKPAPSQRVTCVNPGALLGRETVDAIFPARPRPAGSTGASAATIGMAPIAIRTASYQLSGAIAARCVQTEATDFLGVSSTAPLIASGFARIDASLPGWGLHLIDVNVALGTLIELAGAQSRAWLSTAGGSR